MLYLIKSGKYTKIGFTNNFDKRYQLYITHNPNLEVLGLREGDQFLENKYHQIFINRNYYNEWFDIPQYILEYLVKHQFTISFLEYNNKKKFFLKRLKIKERKKAN